MLKVKHYFNIIDKNNANNHCAQVNDKLFIPFNEKQALC